MSEPEQKVFEVKPPLDSLIDNTSQQVIFNQFIKNRKSDDKDQITYQDIPWKIGEKEYTIKAQPVTIEEIAKKAKSSCNSCNSKGYIIRIIEKSKTPDPENYIVLSDVPFRSLSEDEKKVWVEKQKQSKTWKIALPCICAMKRYIKALMNQTTSDIIMYTQQYNIVMKISYEIKE